MASAVTKAAPRVEALKEANVPLGQKIAESRFRYSRPGPLLPRKKRKRGNPAKQVAVYVAREKFGFAVAQIASYDIP